MARSSLSLPQDEEPPRTDDDDCVQSQPSLCAATTASFPSLSSRPIARRFPSRRRNKPPSKRETQTLVTLRKPPSRTSSSPANADEVSMSSTSQIVLPAIFSATRVDDDPDSRSFSQAAGHDGSFSNEGATLVKKAPEREAIFYEMVQKGCWPVTFLPAYYGRVHPASIKIEDLTYGYQRPCVIDLKMGVHTFEQHEPSRFKKFKMSALDRVTGSRSDGCRLEGLSMYRSMEHVTGNKAQSHSVSMSAAVSLRDVLTFFLTDESGVRTDVAQRFQHMIQNILNHFEQNNCFRFIGSSLLLIYDNDNRAPYRLWARALRNLHRINSNVRLSEDHIVGLTRRTRCDVRMIDFAHWSHSEDGSRDEGYITGLHTILSALRSIRFYRAKPIFSMRRAVEDVLDHEAKSSVTAASLKHAPTEGNAFNFESLWRDLPSASVSSFSSVFTPCSSSVDFAQSADEDEDPGSDADAKADANAKAEPNSSQRAQQ